MKVFCTIVVKIEGVREELQKKKNKLAQMNKLYRVCSATESVADLEKICGKLEELERELRTLVAYGPANVASFATLESVSRLVNNAAESNPGCSYVEEARILVKNSRHALGLNTFSSRMNRLVNGNANLEGAFNLAMGCIYFEGKSGVVDFPKSLTHFLKAASFGSAEAFLYLGRHYREGLGTREDSKKAFKYYMDGAKQQVPDCLYEVGECFRLGYGIKRNDARRFEYYTKAANLRHAGGRRQLAICFESGTGTEVDLVRAAEYKKAAAEAGDVDALVDYGHNSLYGRGIERNVQAAVHLFEIASSVGSTTALVRLGDCYRNGLGVEEDLEESFRLYSRAARENNLSGIGRVGICLVFGLGVARNESLGVQYIQRAAGGGNLFAIRTLAELKRNGIGTEENKCDALELYQRAVEDGSWGANLSLGQMYRGGEGIDVNIGKAIHHFEIYAKYDKDKAHWNLAQIYKCENGFVDEDRALYHFKLAAQLGSTEARDVVSEYFVSVTGPRKLSATPREMQLFIQRMVTIHSCTLNTTRNIIAPQGFEKETTINSQHSDFISTESTLAPVFVQDEDDYGELKELCEIRISKATVSDMPTNKLASVLAAFLVDYDVQMGASFRKIEKCLRKFCENNLVGGAVLVDAEEEDAYAIMDEIIENIFANYGDGSSTAIRRSLKVRLSKFMKHIRNSRSNSLEFQSSHQ